MTPESWQRVKLLFPVAKLRTDQPAESLIGWPIDPYQMLRVRGPCRPGHAALRLGY
jgi:hypothetical protein